jgi:hypothetical protein
MGMITDEGRMTWLYMAEYLTDDTLGPVVGVKITEIHSRQFGPERYSKTFGAWVAKERVESDLALVNWTLGWWAKVSDHNLTRIEILRVPEGS